MATPILVTMGAVATLSAVFLGFLRFGMGASSVVCAIIALPAVVVSSFAALYSQWVLGVSVGSFLTGTGFVLLLLVGAVALFR